MRWRTRLLMQRRTISINTNFQHTNEPLPADEDVDFMHTTYQPHKVKLVTTVDSEGTSPGVHKAARMHWRTPVINHNQAHLQEQFKHNNSSFNYVEVFDTPCSDGVKGLWMYPLFFTQEEQDAMHKSLSPLFRNPAVSTRVKHTCTIARTSMRSELGPKARFLRHPWGERNHPGIAHVGRRNVVHMCSDDIAQSLPKNFLRSSGKQGEGVVKAVEKVWRYFGAGMNSHTGGPKKRDTVVQEWHPLLDRPPNFYRCNEWMEPTSGMNSHVKDKRYGNYIGIINLLSSSVLQLNHPQDSVLIRYDDETPDGLPPSTRVVLHPGSLTILKYDARWKVPYGYSFEPHNVFRLNCWPKDYRMSVMFGHYSESEPGDPSNTLAPPQVDALRDSGIDNLDPFLAGRSERTKTSIAQVPKR